MSKTKDIVVIQQAVTLVVRYAMNNKMLAPPLSMFSAGTPLIIKISYYPLGMIGAGMR